MNNGNRLKSGVFFELGIAFARFSAKPDEDEYNIIQQVASRLELEVPSFRDLVFQRLTDEVTAPPKEWFESSDGESLGNYSRIGCLSFALFLLVQGNKNIDDGAVLEMRALFRAETIPIEIFDDYLKDLKTGNAEGAFRGFLPNFFNAVKPNLEFERINSAPPSFPKDVLEALNHTIDEVSVCYNHGCNLATIGLCGKIVETLLSTAYEIKTGEAAGPLGYHKLRTTLKEQGMPLEGSLDKMLEYINACRNKAVHGNVIIPTEREAMSVCIFTQDVIDRIFGHFNDTPPP